MASNLIGRLAVYLGMYCNSIAFTIIFPFGSKMVQYLGMADDRSTTGFWVGLLAFSMMGARIVTSPIWGSLCDKYGRRPAHLCGILSAAVFSISFGLSNQYWMAVMSRVLVGGMCCLSLVGKIIIGELTNSDPGAMAWVVLSWQLGNISGNIIGGLFQDPVGTGLTDWALFETFPFLLPNLFVSFFAIISLVFSYIYVPETLTDHEHSEYKGRGYIELLKDKKVFWESCVYSLWSLNVGAFHEIMSLWCWANKEDGGFGMDPVEIGNIFFVSALIQLLIGSSIYKTLRRFMNIVTLTRHCSFFGIFVMLAMPLCSLFKDYVYMKYASLCLLCFIWLLNSFMNLTNMHVMQNNCVVNSERGKMNGISMTSNSSAKAISPLLLGSLFALTAKSGLGYPFNFSFVFIVMAGICLLTFLVSLNKNLDTLHTPLQDSSVKERLLPLK